MYWVELIRSKYFMVGEFVMERKKKDEDENEYLNWYWHPASRQWKRHNPLRSRREQELLPVIQTGSSPAETSAQEKTEVYTQEELIRDLRNAFNKGRYRTWRGRK